MMMRKTETMAMTTTEMATTGTTILETTMVETIIKGADPQVVGDSNTGSGSTENRL